MGKLLLLELKVETYRTVSWARSKVPYFYWKSTLIEVAHTFCIELCEALTNIILQLQNLSYRSFFQFHFK